MIFAFFGYNESWAGDAGLDKFKKDLDAFIKHTLAQKYNGKSAPRLVLFSPTALEIPSERDLPDPTAANEQIQLYTAAMAEVAKTNGVVFRRPLRSRFVQSTVFSRSSQSRSTAFT